MNVNRLCASGLQAIVSGAQSLLAGTVKVVVAGGDESMSRLPVLEYDHSGRDEPDAPVRVQALAAVLNDPFGDYPMGMTAEHVASRYDVSRADQDAFALQSQQRAAAAQRAHLFDRDILPIITPTGKEFAIDEHPRPTTTLEKLGALEPVFTAGGSVTAGNSAGINDGAAALVLMRESDAAERGVSPRLQIRSWAVVGIDPDIMGYAPAYAIPKALTAAGLTMDDIDLIELNEAFAAQAVAVVRAIDADEDKVNVWGGAIALGHPLGATGAILTVKLAAQLEAYDGQFGVVSLCIGGGQGMAAVFERV